MHVETGKEGKGRGGAGAGAGAHIKRSRGRLMGRIGQKQTNMDQALSQISFLQVDADV